MAQVLMGGNHRRVKKLPRPVSSRQKFAVGVRLERRAQGLSQEELAEKAGMHPAYIGGVERAERNISIDNMHRIAKALGVSTADLLK
jgi:transcriptional regulator with XRE-family HTH domain